MPSSSGICDHCGRSCVSPEYDIVVALYTEIEETPATRMVWTPKDQRKCRACRSCILQYHRTRIKFCLSHAFVVVLLILGVYWLTAIEQYVNFYGGLLFGLLLGLGLLSCLLPVIESTLGYFSVRGTEESDIRWAQCKDLLEADANTAHQGFESRYTRYFLRFESGRIELVLVDNWQN